MRKCNCLIWSQNCVRNFRWFSPTVLNSRWVYHQLRVWILRIEKLIALCKGSYVILACSFNWVRMILRIMQCHDLTLCYDIMTSWLPDSCCTLYKRLIYFVLFPTAFLANSVVDRGKVSPNTDTGYPAPSHLLPRKWYARQVIYNSWIARSDAHL